MSRGNAENQENADNVYSDANSSDGAENRCDERGAGDIKGCEPAAAPHPTRRGPWLLADLEPVEPGVPGCDRCGELPEHGDGAYGFRPFECWAAMLGLQPVRLRVCGRRECGPGVLAARRPAESALANRARVLAAGGRPYAAGVLDAGDSAGRARRAEPTWPPAASEDLANGRVAAPDVVPCDEPVDHNLVRQAVWRMARIADEARVLAGLVESDPAVWGPKLAAALRRVEQSAISAQTVCGCELPAGLGLVRP